MQEVILTEEQLQEKLAYWQKILRLSDWIITVRIARERDMNLSGCAGEISWSLNNKAASIRILDEIDCPQDLMYPQDMEKTLVHELLHLHLAPISDHFSNDNDIYTVFEEQAIDCIADALVRVSRENGDSP
ncbi:hypothetical protein [Oceanobacillus sojae]|uniref:hypothetical protein n=1 Tax=Oceanobacillus sojae TaxID=582851 RepID=UPI00362BD17A